MKPATTLDPVERIQRTWELDDVEVGIRAAEEQLEETDRLLVYATGPEAEMLRTDFVTVTKFLRLLQRKRDHLLDVLGPDESEPDVFDDAEIP